ncbi:hypothetical protein FCV44_21380 [Vibrio kanaloae]|uniref:Ig-like domain-containing protein n=1 Tax=Vibrio kanaloae TaxID=170673 RepID=UPI0010BEFEC4|nr:Ig-like domain-containing protein [Vibrio kanaloae]TKE89623.1 hypothetical protein FCV44_21380 [Vibrio kanaloae]TKF12465.1 hypothetical protein FCV47_20810 [Vibrio kanaloae]
MSIIKKNAVIALALAGLYGCNSDSGRSSSGDGSKLPATISVTDAVFSEQVSLANYYVDLTKHVVVSDGSQFHLSKVNSLSSDSSCDVVSIEEKGFTVSGSSSKVCDYEYYVEALQNQKLNMGDKSANSRVIFSVNSDSAQLPPLGLVTLQDTELKIDLVTEFDRLGISLEDFELSSDLLLPYKHESYAVADPENKSINFNPEAGFRGIDRIMFSMTNTKGEVKAGVLDIAISEQPNEGIVVEKMSYYPDKIVEGETIDIDISEYVQSKGQEYQLTYVKSFDAIVRPKHPLDTDNKIFTLKPNVKRTFSVTYGVSDRVGNFHVGIIQFDSSLTATAKWDDIYFDNKIYAAPLTTSIADEKGYEYRIVMIDKSYSPPAELVWYNIAQVSDSTCAKYLPGGRIAKYTEMVKLGKAFDIKKKYNWPTRFSGLIWFDGVGARNWARYFASDMGYQLVQYQDLENSGLYCVSDIYLKLDEENSKLKAIANGTDQAYVQVSVPKSYLKSSFYVTAQLNSGSSAELFSDKVKVSADGTAQFLLTNVKSEVVTLFLDFEGVKKEVKITFGGDPENAELSLSVSRNYDPFDVDIVAKLKDVYGNPVLDQTVFFDSDDKRISFNDRAVTNEEGEAIVTASYLRSSGDLLKHLTIPVEAKYSSYGAESIANTNLVLTGGICDEINSRVPYSEFPERSCVKIQETDIGLFSSPATKELVEYFDMIQDTSTRPVSRSYSHLYRDSNNNLDIANFTQYKTNQYVDFCGVLSEYRIAGRDNWQRSSLDKLNYLIENFNPETVLRWPNANGRFAWTSDFAPEGFWQKEMVNDFSDSPERTSSNAQAVCFSPN